MYFLWLIGVFFLLGAVAANAWVQDIKAPLLQSNFTEALLQICRLLFKKNGLERLAEVVELKATALHSLGMDGVRADIFASIRGIYNGLQVNYYKLNI